LGRLAHKNLTGQHGLHSEFKVSLSFLHSKTLSKKRKERKRREKKRRIRGKEKRKSTLKPVPCSRTDLLQIKQASD
jgi:hypothetical protein